MRSATSRQDVAMRRWLIFLPVALAALGVAGCLPGRSPTPRRTPESRAVVVASPTPACPPGELPVRTKLPQPADFSVRVYNGTSRPGLANQIAEELTTRGFKVVRVAASVDPYPQTL